MRDRLLILFSRDWAGLAVAGALALLGVGLVLVPSPYAPWLGAIVVVAAAALAVGAVRHLARVARTRRLHPPPGRLVVIDGAKIHVLAEGTPAGVGPVVWFGGAHSAGLSMDHLHRRLREVTRSILIDRPGTGWSDVGAFPRTTVRETDEMIRALEAAGERGPFVFAGYSFGGLLAANIARRRPDLVARLVLLDATPLEIIVFGPRLEAIRDMRRDSLRTGLLRLFNLDQLHRPRSGAALAQGEPSAAEETHRAALALLTEIEVGAGPPLAAFSIYRELLGPHVASCGWETVVYDGDLGDMSVWLVAPSNPEEVTSNPQIAAADPAEAVRMKRFFARGRERYQAVSCNTRRVVAPEGSTHQFVYEHPDFVADVMRAAVMEAL